MMKMMSTVMIILGCFALGCWYREQFLGRVKSLRMLDTILALLESEVRFMRGTMPECCSSISDQLQEPFRQCFLGIAEEMRKDTGMPFSEVFRAKIEECMRDMPVKREDLNIFFGFLSDTGFADEKMQLRLLERSRERLKDSIDRLDSENVEKCRMAVGLGGLGGLLLVLILC